MRHSLAKERSLLVHGLQELEEILNLLSWARSLFALASLGQKAAQSRGWGGKS